MHVPTVWCHFKDEWRSINIPLEKQLSNSKWNTSPQWDTLCGIDGRNWSVLDWLTLINGNYLDQDKDKELIHICIWLKWKQTILFNELPLKLGYKNRYIRRFAVICLSLNIREGFEIEWDYWRSSVTQLFGPGQVYRML